jgi:hypothetical protein
MGIRLAGAYNHTTVVFVTLSGSTYILQYWRHVVSAHKF